MNDAVSVVLITVGIAAAVIFTIALNSRNTRTLRNILGKVAKQHGWEDIRHATFLKQKVKGRLRGVDVSISRLPPHRSVPARYITVVGAPSNGRLLIRRRFAGWLSNKPLLGPPVVETKQEEWWVCADERTLADRLMSNKEIVELLRTNLVGRMDEVRANARGIRIFRAVDDKPVQGNVAGLGFRWGFHEPTIRRVLTEEWRLAVALTSAGVVEGSYALRKTSESRSPLSS